MKHLTRVFFSLLLALALSLSAMARDDGGDRDGGDSGGDSAPTPVPAANVTPTPSSGVGSDGTVSAAVELSENSMQVRLNSVNTLRATTSAIVNAGDVRWSVTDASVVELSASTGFSVGVIAKGAGRTTVSARVGSGDPATCQVIVSGIALSKTSIEMSTSGVESLEMSRFGDAENVPDSSWEWSSSNTGAAIVQKRTGFSLGATVTAISAGSSVITCTGGGYTAICQVTITANEASVIRTSLTDGILEFGSILSRLESLCRELTGGKLYYITNLDVSTGQGILYDGYVSEGDTGFGVAGIRKYYNGQGVYQIENITFMPKAGVSGDVTIAYTAYDTAEKQFTGFIVVEVDQTQTTLTYASRNLDPVRFRSDDFFAYCMAVNNRSLQSVVFDLPNSGYGTLYYNYVNTYVYESLVSSGTRYTLTYNPSINNVSFVPNPSYAGTFSLTFTGYDSEGRSFEGIVRINVNNPNGSDDGASSSTQRLEYTTGPGARVSFRTADFSEESQDETGYQLSYIYFTSLPSSSRGVLYYDRDVEVEEDTRYYRTGSTRPISGLSFVANRNYTGSVSIPFTGIDTQGKSFRSRIYIYVEEDGAYGVEYSVTAGSRVYFTPTAFNEVCQLATGRNLDHVRFTSRPERGGLYDGTNSEALLNTSYFRSGSGRLIGSVNYLAPDSYRGSVSIPYRGTDVNGSSFQGNVRISISYPSSSSNTSGNTVSYFSTTGPAVQIRSTDITTPAAAEIGEVVSIRLTQPDPDAGRLVTNFISPGRYSAFDSTQEYTPSTIGQVFFLPKGGFSGTAMVQYVARNRQNKVYSSFLRYQVTVPQTSRYFSDLSGRAWAVQAVDFFRNYDILYGVTNNTYEPDGPARRGAFITVLARMYGFPNYAGNGGYEDVDTSRYYAPSIAAARAMGIADEAQYFYPDTPITRAEAAVFLYRCLRRSESITGGTYADVARFSDWYEVPYFGIEAMGALVRLGIFGGDANGRLNPNGTLTRLQMAAILYRAVAGV